MPLRLHPQDISSMDSTIVPEATVWLLPVKENASQVFSHEASSYVFRTTFNSASGAVRRFLEGRMRSVYACSRREAHYHLNQVYAQSVVCIRVSVSVI